MDTTQNTTAAPVTARADIKGIVMIGQWGDTEIIMTVDVPRSVWNMIDAPEEWVGTLSATKRVKVGNITTQYWMATYAGNDMEVGA